MNEQEYLENYNIHDYPIPLATVDMAIFSVRDDRLKVLLVKRSQHPALGCWALPGGFIDIQQDRTLDDTARRKLEQKTGVDTPYLEQLQTFGGMDRDPRGWSMTVAYFALIASQELSLMADDSSEEIDWVDVNKAVSQKSLAFDHTEILTVALERLRKKVEYTSLPVNLLPDKFTLSELQATYEIVLGNNMSKKSFRKRFLDANILTETGEYKTGPARPAKLYRASDEGLNHFFARNLEAHK